MSALSSSPTWSSAWIPTSPLPCMWTTDEANAFANENQPTGVILKLFGGRTYNLQKWAEELQSGIHRL